MPDICDRAAYWRENRNRRDYQLEHFEFRDDGPTGFTFEGVASVVDKPYEVVDMFGPFTETVRAGAFSKTLKDSKADVALFLNHDYRGIPLATRNSGSLTLAADPNLRVNAGLNPLRSDVRDVQIAVVDRILNQMSIGFTVPKGKDDWNDDFTQRTIHEVKLIETSIVWQGANPHTSASMRSISEMVDALTSGEVEESELRRIIDHLGSLLPAAEVTPELFPVTEDELVEFWGKALA